MINEQTLPTDVYSSELRRLRDNPAKMEAKSTTIDLQTFLGAAETWTVRTVNVDGRETVFLQCVNASGGARYVLPPEVSAAIARQRDVIVGISRRRGAAKAKATRAMRAAEAAAATPAKRGAK
jgi:hypothetical protein